MADSPQQPDSDESSSDEMAAYLQVYLDESEEELESLVAELLTLEGDPRNVDALNEAFRLLHTLKGSSGMMGFESVSELAHEFENRFESFRTGEKSLDKATMNLLLECVDFFQTFHTQLRRGEKPEGDSSHLIDRLSELEERPPVPSGSEESTIAASGAMTDRSTQTLALQGAYRVEVRFEPKLQLADLKARLIIARLSKIGEIVATDPPIDDIQSVDDLPRFAVIVMSNHDPKEVREIADVDGVESIEIEGASMLEAADAMSLEKGSLEKGLKKKESTDKNDFVEKDRSTGDISTGKDNTETKLPSPEAQTLEFLSPLLPTPEPTPTPAPSVQPIPPAATESIPAQVSSFAPVQTDATPPSLTTKKERPKVTETVRVDIDRLDRLMNLTGELVVTRARFTQIASDMNPLFRNQSVSCRAKDLGERLRLQLKKIMELSSSQETPSQDALSEDWEDLFKELEADLVGLEQQSTLWEEARRHFTQITESVDHLSRVANNLQQSVLETRMVQVAPLFNRFRRVIRDLSMDRNKRVQLAIAGEKTELDKRMVDELGDPLIHLVRNAIDHGLEAPEERVRLGKPEVGTIHLEASQSGNNVFIHVRDDGAGVNVERIRQRLLDRGLVTEAGLRELSEQQVIDFIWHPGFSTAEQVTDISGRGIGMDVVRNRILDLNGTIEVDSKSGQGTTFTIRLPLTLAIIRSLLIRFRDTTFSLPIDDVREIVSVPQNEVYSLHNHRTIDVRGEFIPLAGMHEVFQWNTFPIAAPPITESLSHDLLDSPQQSEKLEQPHGTSSKTSPPAVNVVVLQNGGQTLGLCVDELLGGTDIVIKSLADNFCSIRGLSGASVMGDGTVCLMLDVNAVTELAFERARPKPSSGTMASEVN